ncbi:hypothetical protein C8Q80DRAFT_1116735 [Daedaleopsis nitida]|nr:hypothetical protein C8Q80DRAFT_1116735 [Daedaleopsis nitida]
MPGIYQFTYNGTYYYGRFKQILESRDPEKGLVVQLEFKDKSTYPVPKSQIQAVIGGWGYEPHDPIYKVAWRLYIARLASLRSLPLRLVDAIPTLKLIGTADESPNCTQHCLELDSGIEAPNRPEHLYAPDDQGTSRVESELEASPPEGEEQREESGCLGCKRGEMKNHTEDEGYYFHERADYAHCSSDWDQEKVVRLQWWRVIDVDGERKVKELTVSQGGFAQSLLLGGSNTEWLEHMDALDGSAVSIRFQRARYSPSMGVMTAEEAEEAAGDQQ